MNPRPTRTILVTLALALALAAYIGRPPSHRGDLDLAAFGKVPAVMDGRVKPMDSVARNTMRLISERQAYVDPDGNRRPAMDWLADLLAVDLVSPTPQVPNDPEKLRNVADSHVFRIHNPQVLKTIGLERRKRFRYSLNEIEAAPNYEKFLQLGREASQKLQRKEKLSFFQDKLHNAYSSVMMVKAINIYRRPLLVPDTSVPIPKDRDKQQWLSYAEADHIAHMSATPNPYAEAWRIILAANAHDRAVDFNAAVSAYRNRFDQQFPDLTDRTRFEYHYNHVAPYFQCFIFSILLGLLGALGLLFRVPRLITAANTLTVFVLVVAFVGFLARMYLMDRLYVFVTNLYSSAIFVGFIGMAAAYCLERIYKLGIGPLLASAIGSTCFLVAINLDAKGDNLAQLQAVLDTNFWLATHVTTVTMGYSATFLAGALGAFFIFAGVFNPNFSPKYRADINRMTYGTICFALLLSFVGTVTGGIWADQSWGRFWGWDVKENGALIIVLWNALILHARWAGMVKPRGIAVLAVFGNCITAFSWFGVNMLNVGLHSYGPMESGALYLGLFVISQLFIMAIGMMPQSKWASNQNKPNASPDASTDATP